MMKLGTHIKISGNGNVFNKKKVWGNQGNDCKSRKSKKDKFCDPVSEVQSQESMDRVTHKQVHLNGTQLQIKDLQSIESEMVVTFFKVSMMTPKEVTLAELTKILLEAQKRASDDLLDTTTYDFFMDNGIKIGQSLPPMNLCIQVTMLKGLSHHAQAHRSWHLEVDSKYVVKMKGLDQCAKEYGCVEEVWGGHTHLSKVADAKSTAPKAKQQVDVV
jgi:hypothetical protein